MSNESAKQKAKVKLAEHGIAASISGLQQLLDLTTDQLKEVALEFGLPATTVNKLDKWQLAPLILQYSMY